MPDQPSLEHTAPEDVLTFWLGPPGAPPLENATRWYAKDDAFDREIRTRFAGAIERAVRGDLDTWKTTPRGRLAFVILLDQFSRNMFRGTPRAFAQDGLASAAALEAIAAGDERVLSIVERSFLYMPLEHSEDRELQQRCVTAFEHLLADAPADLEKFVVNALDYAKRHAEIIERFGRFPHRSAILGRTSSPEELAFLEQPGSSF
ncbi:MAG TPA: DUF924 family protein [Labilithrix sp.]|nr:DUF924 family protein [Labilithrix sp.]